MTFGAVQSNASGNAETFANPNLVGVGASAVLGSSTLAGVAGAWTEAGEVGSPGVTSNSAVITEVDPNGSGNAAYGADWFEVTNRGSTPIEITGWSMDDNSDSAADAVPMVMPSSSDELQAGKSMIFIENTDQTTGNTPLGPSDTQALIAKFEAAWFGSSVPSDLVVGTYAGAAVGLSSGGDAVNLFDSTGTPITGVSFGSSIPTATFDNTAGMTTITTMSTIGTDGAFMSATSNEVGSPGTASATAAGPGAAQLSFDTPTFPLQPAGTFSPSETLTVTNTGSAAADITAVNLDADPATLDDWALKGETCTAAPLAPGASCTVRVRFEPGVANVTEMVNVDFTVTGNVMGATSVQLTATSTTTPQGPTGPDRTDGRDRSDRPGWTHGPHRSDGPDRSHRSTRTSRPSGTSRP